MSCRDIKSQLERGATRASLSSEHREHLESCDACTALEAEQAQVSQSLSMMPKAEAPIGTADRAFRAAMSGESSISPVSFWERLVPLATPVAAGAAAAAIIALLIGGPTPVKPTDVTSSADLAAFELLDDDASDVEIALADDLFALEDE